MQGASEKRIRICEDLYPKDFRDPNPVEGASDIVAPGMIEAFDNASADGIGDDGEDPRYLVRDRRIVKTVERSGDSPCHACPLGQDHIDLFGAGLGDEIR